jgi:hypothetical protein
VRLRLNGRRGDRDLEELVPYVSQRRDLLATRRANRVGFCPRRDGASVGGDVGAVPHTKQYY